MTVVILGEAEREFAESALRTLSGSKDRADGS